MAVHKKPESGLYDVVIVGGGLSGMTMACVLGHAGMRVAVIEAAPPVAKQSRDLRTTAISYGSRAVLERAGVWGALEAGACPIEDIRILDGDSPVLLDFLSEDVGGKAFGWIVENYDLRAALARQAEALPAVDVFYKARIKTVRPVVELASGETIEAQLLIGADGRRSFVREALDIPVRGWDYGQRAVICTLGHKNPHHNKAIEHFWPQGPFAVLPMADDAEGKHRSSLVFTEHGPKQKSLMTMSDETFLAAVAARLPEDYGAVRVIGQRACYPLALTHATRYIADRAVLIADAAHGIHPIAGQGLNLGFRDIDLLATLLIEAYDAGGDLGDTALLERYERQRRVDNTAMVAVTDGLVRLFSTGFGPVSLLRRAGLKAVSRLPPAKRFFMKQAMGDR